MQVNIKNRVVYTCLVGNYDNVPCHNYVDDRWDYILFSDNEELIKKGKIYHWNVRKNPFNKLDGTRNSRYVKINPHLVLQEYKYSFYIDANILVNNHNFFDTLEDIIKKDIKISIPLHPERKCIYEEAKVIKERYIDYPKLVKKQVSFLKSEGYPQDNELFENGLIFRQHNDDDIVKAQKLWWNMVINYSKRDQLSGVYSFWKYGIEIKPLYEKRGYHRTCDELSFVYISRHNQNIVKSVKIVPKWLANILVAVVPIKKYRRKLKEKLMSIRIIK